MEAKPSEAERLSRGEARLRRRGGSKPVVPVGGLCKARIAAALALLEPRRLAAHWVGMTSAPRALSPGKPTPRAIAAVIAVGLMFESASGAPAETAPPPSDDVIFAYGGLSCLDWAHPTKFIGDNLRHWLTADVRHQVAASRYRPEIAEAETPARIFAWVDGYCRQHPLRGLDVAAVELVNGLATGWDEKRR